MRVAAGVMKYAITEPARGGVLAECYIDGCYQIREFETRGLAVDWLVVHMRRHGERITRQNLRRAPDE